MPLPTAPTPCATLPVVTPQGFALADAVIVAGLVETAYAQFADWVNAGSPYPWSWTPPSDGFTYSDALWANLTILTISNNEPFGFVAADGTGNAYVIFRGTMTKADEVYDAYISQTPYTLVSNPDYGSVHEGFFDIYQQLSGPVQTALSQAYAAETIHTLYLGGHSMGAALATLALPDVVQNWVPGTGVLSTTVYNFGCPRTGDVQFACAVNGASSPVFRVVNTEDLVPTAPLAVAGSTYYEHVGTQVPFTAQYLSITGNHSMANCYSFAVNSPNNPQGPQPTAFVNLVTGAPQDGNSGLVLVAAPVRIPAVSAP